MIHKICILGSTGSIGCQALDVIRNLKIDVLGLAANNNIDLLENQIREFKPKIVAVYNLEASKILKERIKDTKTKVVSGMDGLCEVASFSDTEMILNSVTGMIGLIPTISAIKAKKTIALANKETLVTGGELVMKLAKENGVKILPVDSEHSAIFQCLQGCHSDKEINKIILTASGGPFWGMNMEQLKNVTLEQTLKHPNWSMGAKITVDSATMMNKGLEVIEAAWLFNLPVEKIDVLVHRESIVHSMVEFKDKSIIAQMGVPDMRIPIQYAITYPERVKSEVEALNFIDNPKLTFSKPDYDTFSCLKLCIEAYKIGETMPTIVNAANEKAVEFYLNGKIKFLDIPNLVKGAMENIKSVKVQKLDDVLNSDKQARDYVIDKVKYF